MYLREQGMKLHPNTKLTEDDVRLLRQVRQERDRLRRRKDALQDEMSQIQRELSQLTYSALAEKFEVSTKAIDSVLNRKSHRCIE